MNGDIPRNASLTRKLKQAEKTFCTSVSASDEEKSFITLVIVRNNEDNGRRHADGPHANV